MYLVHVHLVTTALKVHPLAHQITACALQVFTVLLEADFLPLVVREPTLLLLESLIVQFVLKAFTVSL